MVSCGFLTSEINSNVLANTSCPKGNGGIKKSRRGRKKRRRAAPKRRESLGATGAISFWAIFPYFWQAGEEENAQSPGNLHAGDASITDVHSRVLERSKEEVSGQFSFSPFDTSYLTRDAISKRAVANNVRASSRQSFKRPRKVLTAKSSNVLGQNLQISAYSYSKLRAKVVASKASVNLEERP